MSRNRPIQIMIVLVVLSLIGIIAVQVYWVTQAVNEQEETFDHKVRMSLRSVADQMCQIDGNELITTKPIDRIAGNYYIARLQYNIDIPILESLLSQQFKERGIGMSYEYGVYNCESDQMVFGNRVNLTGKQKPDKLPVPKLTDDEYYFGVYFPDKKSQILSEMSLWKFMTAGTFLMILFFGYGLVIVLKQKRLSEIQKDFIDNVTHELKTPLATLKISAEALVSSAQSEKEKKYASIIQSETLRLQEHVERVLTASLLDAGSKPEMREVDAGAFLKVLLSRFKEEYPDVEWDEEVQPSLKIHANEKALETVIRNVVENAVKYGNGRVRLEAQKEMGGIALRIVDNGPGIPKGYQNKVFGKFFRVPTEDVHDVKGYGLGLYIVRQNMKRMGGSIKLSSTEKGMCVRLLFKPI